MRLARADALDAMVDGANAGRQKQPFRRVRSKLWIEDHRARDRQRMTHHLLHFGGLVGDPGAGAEVAAGDRGRRADLAHDGGIHRRRRALDGPDLVDAFDGADIVGKAKLDGLGAVGDRAAADGDDQVGVGGAGLLGCGDHRRARRMRRHRVEGGGMARAQSAADFLDFVGLAVEGPADHQEGAGRAHAIHLLDNSFGGGSPEHDLLHGAEYDTPFMHACPPRTFWLCKP